MERLSNVNQLVGKELAIVRQEQEQVSLLEKEVEKFLFKSEVASKLNDIQKDLFKRIALSMRLNPFMGEIYAIPFKGEMAIVVSYQVYLRKTATLIASLNTEEIRDEAGNVVAIKVLLKRKGWEIPFEHIAYMKEERKNTAIWQQRPIFMLKKVAVVQALRFVFADILQGVPYAVEELDGVEDNGNNYNNTDNLDKEMNDILANIPSKYRENARKKYKFKNIKEELEYWKQKFISRFYQVLYVELELDKIKKFINDNKHLFKYINEKDIELLNNKVAEMEKIENIEIKDEELEEAIIASQEEE